MRIFPKVALIAKKRPLKVTNTVFLLREVEQIGVYQLLPQSLYENTLDVCFLVVSQ